MKALPDLPVVSLCADVSKALIDGNVLLSAEPGAGKSTVLPLALLDQAGLDGRILLLEPRRLAARSVAERLSYHLGESIGGCIGLRMRGLTCVSENTRIEVVTEGVLTRLLQADPSLQGVSLVIFDEFHERSLHADVGLSLCLEVQHALREDLRLLLMSATLETQKLSEFIGSCGEFHCRVRQHDVDIRWVAERHSPLPQRIASTVINALMLHEGDVLVFLPGIADIHKTAELLRQSELSGRSDLQIHPLHGGVDMDAQVEATRPARSGQRRVILATSIAETSITVVGVRIVIDSGLERRAYLDSATGAQRLETVPSSQASATQRAGRAGRTAAGVCYRLWAESGHTRRPAHWQAEIYRADLAPLVIELGLWGAPQAESLPWLDAPPSASLSRARALLETLGLWQADQLTPPGRQVAALPVHPRLGKMLIWARQRGAHEQACRMSILLEDHRQKTMQSDIELMLTARLSISHQKLFKQLLELLNQSDVSQITELPKPSAAVVLAQAYPDWIAKRRAINSADYLLACGAGVTLDANDSLFNSQWLVVARLGGGGKLARIFQALKLDIAELELHSPNLFAQIDSVIWDKPGQRVKAERQVLLGSIVVSTHNHAEADEAQKIEALMDGIRQHGIECLPWSDQCRQWQARVQRLRQLLDHQQLSEWPMVDDAALTEQLSSWLQPWLQGMATLKSLQQLNLHTALRALLSYQQQSLLDEWLPERYTVPSGSLVRLNYIGSGSPVLSVKLQEMLGSGKNPTIAMGRVPLKVELLSPARRPVQITEDLAGFWKNSYPEVKKEMAGRYPKHDWPEDPLSAQPTAQARRRRH